MNNLLCPIIKQVSWSKNAPSICSVYLQKALQQRHGWRWFQPVAMFWLCQNSRPKVYKDVHFKTDTDVRGSMQRRVFAEQNSSLSNVHGGTLLNTATDGGGSKQ